jgi:hypothetical protein
LNNFTKSGRNYLSKNQPNFSLDGKNIYSLDEDKAEFDGPLIGSLDLIGQFAVTNCSRIGDNTFIARVSTVFG